ncbi:hypothetical protein Pst134EB_014764 [Puccinia striiformis f. sp. tritici]|nr:hypothetical protein Pst134EB_014764 [Puccinia striiformis f. sp. tritici]
MLNFSILFSLPEQLQGFIRNRQIRNVWKINLKDRCPDFRSSKKINHTDFRFEREIPILRRIVPPNALVRDHADESFLSLLAIKLKGIWLGLTIWAASEASLPMTSPVLHKTNRPTYPEMIRPDDFKKFKADIREQVRKDAVRMDQHKALVDEIGLGTREAPPGTFPDYVIIGKQASELQKACALGSSTSNQLLEFSSQYMQDSHDSLLRRTIAIKLESELKRQLFPDLPITSRQRSHNDVEISMRFPSIVLMGWTEPETLLRRSIALKNSSSWSHEGNHSFSTCLACLDLVFIASLISGNEYQI